MSITAIHATEVYLCVGLLLQLSLDVVSRRLGMKWNFFMFFYSVFLWPLVWFGGIIRAYRKCRQCGERHDRSQGCGG